jgi:3-deoxy-manno-octulosonate cytidylyltransferase (CMP-KDO synthetase)
LSKANGKIVAVIPARYASTRLPGKPFVDLCGKPMVQHVYERTIKSRLVNHVIVATDDVMTPANIQSGSDRIAFVANNLVDASIIVNVQGDEPLIEPEMIDQAIEPLMNETKYNVSTLVKKISRTEELVSPNIVKVVLDTEMCGIYFSRSPIPHLRDFPNIQDWILNQTFYKHIGLYVYRKDFLNVYVSWKESVLERAEKLEQLRIIENGEKIKVAITEYDSIPVDTLADAELVRQILQKK